MKHLKRKHYKDIALRKPRKIIGFVYLNSHKFNRVEEFSYLRIPIAADANDTREIEKRIMLVNAR